MERELIIVIFPISSGQASGERRYEAILRGWFWPVSVKRITNLLSQTIADLVAAGSRTRLRVCFGAWVKL